jgi:hypothetical protein
MMRSEILPYGVERLKIQYPSTLNSVHLLLLIEG